MLSFDGFMGAAFDERWCECERCLDFSSSSIMKGLDMV